MIQVPKCGGLGTPWNGRKRDLLVYYAATRGRRARDGCNTVAKLGDCLRFSCGGCIKSERKKRREERE